MAVGSYSNQQLNSALGSLAATTRPPRSGTNSMFQALEKSRAFKDQAASYLNAGIEAGNQQFFNAATQGLENQSRFLQTQIEEDVLKQQQKAMEKQEDANTLGTVVGIGSTIAGLFCERRLKQDIVPMSDVAPSAWQTVRDLPLYSFAYKAHPGMTVYGPMADEVEGLDATLVRPFADPQDDTEIVRGFDVMRHQAYESVALQQALRRIEALEQRLAALEGAAHPPLALAVA